VILVKNLLNNGPSAVCIVATVQLRDFLKFSRNRRGDFKLPFFGLVTASGGCGAGQVQIAKANIEKVAVETAGALDMSDRFGSGCLHVIVSQGNVLVPVP